MRAAVNTEAGAAPALRRNCFAVEAVTAVTPATTTTEADPSGQRESTAPRSEASSAEITLCPLGTAPSSGYTAAKYGSVPVCDVCNVKVGIGFAGTTGAGAGAGVGAGTGAGAGDGTPPVAADAVEVSEPLHPTRAAAAASGAQVKN